ASRSCCHTGDRMILSALPQRFPSPGPKFFRDGRADPAFLAEFGITRVGDLTGLDRVGIPVWFAARPNSRGLSVSQGNGMTHEQARISAVMEGIEGAIAEQTAPLIERNASIREMRQSGQRIVPLSRMQRCRGRQIDEERTRSWVRGMSLRTGE